MANDDIPAKYDPKKDTRTPAEVERDVKNKTAQTEEGHRNSGDPQGRERADKAAKRGADNLKGSGGDSGRRRRW